MNLKLSIFENHEHFCINLNDFDYEFVKVRPGSDDQ